VERMQMENIDWDAISATMLLRQLM
jgi:hypothetical protein